MKKNTQGQKSWIRDWTESLVVAFVLAMIVRTFFVQAYKIPTASMVPTLIPGDKIFVSKMVYGPRVPLLGIRLPGLRKPKRGDIVVFIEPTERKKVYVKRLIGFPKDRVEIKYGSVYINGTVVADPRVSKNFYYNEGPYGEGEITVPEGYYFMLGDNSANSYDGRKFGFVPVKDLLGEALVIWWPFNRIGWIK